VVRNLPTELGGGHRVVAGSVLGRRDIEALAIRRASARNWRMLDDVRSYNRAVRP